MNRILRIGPLMIVLLSPAERSPLGGARLVVALPVDGSVGGPD